ncbi:cytochrome P450 [Aspergillus keveii]|uniref:Cytochrome P450 n=1 Tax=Aspergillus keveii TaxID=714993 RepID=A0ABR4G2Y5_9EURO
MYTLATVIACAALIVSELYFSFERHGRYYNPWAGKPTIIDPSRKNLLELSDTPTPVDGSWHRKLTMQMFGFKNTLNGFDHTEVNTRKTRLFARVLLVNGPNQLENIYANLRNKCTTMIEHELAASPQVGGSACQRLTAGLMGIIFFGEKICRYLTRLLSAVSQPDFADALRRHPQQITTCMGISQVTPSFLSPLIHAIITRRGRAMHVAQLQIIKAITDCINSGLSSDPASDSHSHSTILQSMVTFSRQNSNYWTPFMLSQSILGLWFAASFQPWVTLHTVILELCLRPEWQRLLREEIESSCQAGCYTPGYSELEQLPLLDSFMREVSRLRCLDKYAIRRKALKDYTFVQDIESDSDTGSSRPISIPAGSTVCVSSYNILHNPSIYPDPESFDGRRFIQPEHEQKHLQDRGPDSSSGGCNRNRYTEVSEENLLWGYGSLACPGRHHASTVLKLLLVNFLMNFEMRLVDENKRSSWCWEEFTLPVESTRVLLTRRARGDGCADKGS